MTATAIAAPREEPFSIDQARGADKQVKYRDLQKFGPWDDRNYRLTRADLKYLSPDEHKLVNQLPAFFRVELRKEWPHLRKSGPAQYPRAALQLFGIRHGGLMRNGVIKRDRRKHARKPVEAGKEVQLNQILGANEITVEINPANPLQVIAGANNAGGQEMYYSTDGGVTWTIQGVLPDTCCDPTIDWSSDGSVAYVGALSGAIGVSTWRSFDGGQTWVDRVNLTASGSDKEFIHVDRSPTSPYQDNLYITYHNGNTMQFGRSTDQGATYDIQAFPGAPFGIGSDITTDANGVIYYVYGAFSSQTIELLRSTDGGTTFEAPVSIASTNGAFDFPIPSMDTRFAWIYASTNADRSGGTYDGSVYVAWADTVNPETPNAADNNTRVYVAYSRDAGATWTLTTPHSTADMDTVDRWNPWVTVDDFGNVHVVFYDTRNSVDRTGVDLYYSYSSDGAQSWSPPERISSATSANLTDGQEFGDYNGLSVLGDTVISTWTDNRDGPPNAKDVYADEAVNVVALPGFSLNATPQTFDACANTQLPDITVSVGSVQGFVAPVTLDFANLPAGFSGGFTPNPVTPGAPANTSITQVTVGAVATGAYSFDIVGTAVGANGKLTTVNVDAFDSAPAGTTLLTPFNGEVDVSTVPLLSWAAVAGASGYTVEIDDDPGFGSIDFSGQTVTNSTTTPVSLNPETTYYWRVRADNACGTGVNSATFSFTTALEFCSATFGPIPDGNSLGTSETIALANNFVISDLNVELQVTHTWVGDLVFNLVHESTGTSVVLIDRPGYTGSGFGCGNDNVDVTLDDEGTSPVENACAVNPAIGGSLTPNQPLSAFDGEQMSGTWRLEAIDFVGPDPGTVDVWCLVPELVDPNADDDNDGVANFIDICPNTPPGEPVDANGCSVGQLDDDNDGVANALDQCPVTPPREAADANGCSANQLNDDDNDGLVNSLDQCPNTPGGAPVNADGCAVSQLDSDRDNVSNDLDLCPNTPLYEPVNADGCSTGDLDDDNDGVPNSLDRCPNTGSGQAVDAVGCATGQANDDFDNDGVPNGSDNCTLVANSNQTDVDGDDYGNVCDADLDNNGIVTSNDMRLLRRAFDTNDPVADLNDDNVVDTLDLAILRNSLFLPPGPSGPAQ